MRDKIVVYEKIAFKTVNRPTSPYEKKHLTRQFRSITLSYIVGSHLLFDI